jgi:hypothetical protein
MKDSYLFLVLLSLPLLIIAGLALADPLPQATGIVHSAYPSMQHSANSQAADPLAKYLGYALGLAILGIFGMSLYWGSRRAKDRGFTLRDLLLGMLLYVLTYSALVFSSWKYDQTEAPLWGDLPVPTAWMLYGIWFVPLVFIVLYVYGFRKHVLSKEDEEAFHEMIKNQAAEKQS